MSNENGPTKIKIVQGAWEKPVQIWVPIIIAVCALSFSYLALRNAKKYQELSNFAHLDTNYIHDIYEKPPNLTIQFTSNGNGVAVITEFQAYVDGAQVQYDYKNHVESWRNILSPLKLLKQGLIVNAMDKQMVLGKGEKWKLLYLSERYSTVDRVERFAEILKKRLTIVVCYCDIFNKNCSYTKFGSKDFGNVACPK